VTSAVRPPSSVVQVDKRKDLDFGFGFGFLPVLSEMGEIREFWCFSVKFLDKI
jgi:hypothetical protein